jgi:uncharacterized protein
MKSIALRSPIPSIVGLVFALGWPFVLFLIIPSRAQPDITNARQDLQTVVAEWAAVLILALIIVFWERLPFAASIGLRKPSWFDALATVLALVATVVTFAIVELAMHLPKGVISNIDPAKLQAMPFLLRLLLVLTAGFCEEVLFRGYAVERLALLTGRVWIGAFVAIVLFTLAHVARYGFSPSLIGVAVTGVFLTLLYAWRRNLWPCIAMHWTIDGIALLLAPAFVHPH